MFALVGQDDDVCRPYDGPPGRELTRIDHDDFADRPALYLRDVPDGTHFEASGSKRCSKLASAPPIG